MRGVMWRTPEPEQDAPYLHDCEACGSRAELPMIEAKSQKARWFCSLQCAKDFGMALKVERALAGAK